MPKVESKAVAIIVDYVCEECGEGVMEVDKTEEMTIFAEHCYWWHKCTNCGYKQEFNKKYPNVIFRREGNIVNISGGKEDTYINSEG